MNEYTVIGMVVAAFIRGRRAVLLLSRRRSRRFAHKVGAIDVPKDNRRMHKEPIPRLGRSGDFRRLPLLHSDFRSAGRDHAVRTAWCDHHCRARHFRRCSRARRKAQICRADRRGGHSGLRRRPADQSVHQPESVFGRAVLSILAFWQFRSRSSGSSASRMRST